MTTHILVCSALKISSVSAVSMLECCLQLCILSPGCILSASILYWQAASTVAGFITRDTCKQLMPSLLPHRLKIHFNLLLRGLIRAEHKAVVVCLETHLLQRNSFAPLPRICTLCGTNYFVWIVHTPITKSLKAVLMEILDVNATYLYGSLQILGMLYWNVSNTHFESRWLS